jgi:hypothetical protein
MEYKQRRILYIGLGCVFVFGLFLVVVSYFNERTSSEMLISSNQIPAQQNKAQKEEGRLWIGFDSKKDTGLSLGVRFNYPATWLQNGSRDSGAVSIVPFFDKSKYSKKCETTSKGAVNCSEIGIVAQIVVSDSSYDTQMISYGNQKNEKIMIDGRTGTKVSGIVKTESLDHVASVGQKETRVVVKGSDGIYYAFIMVTESTSQDELFNEIISTTNFGNK